MAHGSVRVYPSPEGRWRLASCRIPILECDTEAEAWRALAVLALKRSAMRAGPGEL